MKSNEIVQEGFWDNVKNPIAYLKGATTSGQTGAGSVARAQGQQEITKLAKQAEPSWFKAQAAYQQQGVDPKQMGDYLSQWARKWFEVPNLPAYSQAVKSPQVTDQGVRQYLQIAASQYMAPALQQQQQGQPTQQQAQQQPAQAQQAAPAQSTQAATQPAQQQSSDPVHAILKDPNAFKAEWDKFIASKPNYKLIADPQLLSVLKNMWMRSGGMKAESKKNKGKSV